jgi:trimethylamine--corrinoid protein Co-methyltransferase
LRGVEVNDDTLAVDVTRRVGIGGDFLGEEHTLRNFRKEFAEPSVLFRGRREAWEAAGSKPLHEVAEQKADQFIAGDRVPSLSDEQAKALRKFEDDFLGKC